MGKGWKTKHAAAYQPQPPWRGSAQPHWSIWPGAWRSPRRGWDEGQKEPKEDLGGQFPEYDKAWKRAPGIAVLQSSNTPKENHGGLVPTMQNVVNQARKVETKLARLRDEQLQRTRGWEIYLADVKQRVSKEKSKHEAAQQRLSKEISDLEAAQIAVYEQVTEVALQSQRQGLQPLQAAPAATQSMDVDLGLESPMENDLPPDVDLASELQRILGAYQKLGRANSAGAPSTPTRRRTDWPAMTPSSTKSPRSGAARSQDSYMVPPAQRILAEKEVRHRLLQLRCEPQK